MDVLDRFGDVLSLSSLVAAIVGGAIAGAGLAAIHPVPVNVRKRLLAHFVFVLWLLALFSMGRIATALFEDDPNLGRILGSAVLQVIFALATIPGGWLTYRWRV